MTFSHILRRHLSRPGFVGRLTIATRNRRDHFGAPPRQDQTAFVDSAEMTVHRSAFFRRAVLFGQSGFGKSYVEGDFTTADLRGLLLWFVQNRELLPGMGGNKSSRGVVNRGSGLLRLLHALRKNTRRGSRRNISAHYDLSNEFYALWLDSTMTYSSAVFTSQTGDDLQAAQEEKYRRICEKLSISDGDHVLEIGCGWGGFAEYAAKTRGCRLTITTISDAQHAYVQRRLRSAGLEDRVTLLKEDYRDLRGQYDKIVSIEMMEALGHEYVPTFINKCFALLVPGGTMCFQCITVPDAHFEAYLATSDFIRDYIFPGSELLSLGRVIGAAHDAGFRKIGEESIGRSYAQTLRLWAARFGEKMDGVIALGFDERFCRMWLYYLVSCEVAFMTGYIDDVQVVLEKKDGGRTPAIRRIKSPK